MRLWIFVLIALVSCEDERLQDDPIQSVVDGVWQGSCQDQGNGQWRVSIYEFSYSSKVRKVDTFFSDDCQTESYQAVYQGNYETSVTWTSYVHKIRMTITDSSVTLLDPSAFDLLSGCDLSPLALEEPIVAAQLEEEACPVRLSGDFVYQSRFLVSEDSISAAIPFGEAVEDLGGDETLDVEFGEPNPLLSYQKVN